MAPDHPDEVFGRVSRQRGLVKVCVGRDEVVGSRVKIREIAPASAGYSNFLTGGLFRCEEQNPGATRKRLACAHQPGRVRPPNDNGLNPLPRGRLWGLMKQ